jgi:hypothetical protein
MANVFLEPNETFTSAGSNTIFGRSGGDEGVVILDLASNVEIDQNIERVGLPGQSGDWLYQQAGNTLKIFKADGIDLLASMPVQDDVDGTLITFGNGSFSAKLSAGVMTLGAGTVPSAAPGPVNDTSPGPV